MSSNCAVRCGVAGWSYPDWNTVVYPRSRSRAFHPLEYLAGYFDTVEINTSFYRPLRPEVARLWVNRTADNPRFQFTAKLHRRFTHDRVVEDADAEVYARGLRVLLDEGRLGCVLMQFPWSFRFSEENRDFLIRLRRAFHRFPLVAELRHGSWTRDEALGVFIDYHIGFCNIDQPQHWGATPPTALLTSGIGYLRLHGRNYGDWFRQFEEPRQPAARRDYLYSVAELAQWQQRLDRIRPFADSLYIIMNNDAAGRSVVNALQMQALYGLGSGTAPSRLARFYRRELPRFQPDAPVQDSLFDDQRAVA